MTGELSQHELRERLIADLPALVAQFEAEHGPVETQPLVVGRDTPADLRRRVSCPEKRAVLGAPVSAPAKGRHGGYRGVRGPRPRNISRVRDLMQQGLPVADIVKHTGLNRRTVMTIHRQLEEDARSAIKTKADFQREWRMRHSRTVGLKGTT